MVWMLAEGPGEQPNSGRQQFNGFRGRLACAGSRIACQRSSRPQEACSAAERHFLSRRVQGRLFENGSRPLRAAPPSAESSMVDDDACPGRATSSGWPEPMGTNSRRFGKPERCNLDREPSHDMGNFERLL